jgi:hypothetical protein
VEALRCRVQVVGMAGRRGWMARDLQCILVLLSNTLAIAACKLALFFLISLTAHISSSSRHGNLWKAASELESHIA